MAEETASKLIEGFPQNLWLDFRYICMRKKITVKATIIGMVRSFVQANEDILNSKGDN